MINHQTILEEICDYSKALIMRTNHLPLMLSLQVQLLLIFKQQKEEQLAYIKVEINELYESLEVIIMAVQVTRILAVYNLN
ncbi:unnamed protein product [Paramecium primaurelia]|uniref:Uncharacterized protein n=1 Tax=Paramecium primaurelia TaxID=5886 RepID=A0A8S1QHK8_PARPR|nr:unnamed protein product [Paramecium primaurelia]